LDQEKTNLGCTPQGRDRCEFLVWAPRAERVDVRVVAPAERLVPMQRLPRGYHCAAVEGLKPGSRYFYRLDGRTDRPDPASRFQPLGVHGPSEAVDPHYDWHDSGWKGLALERYIFYELHAGTFTPEGTLDAIVPRLDDLKELGITAVELMPVAQFPGSRNWGYDGVYPFAVHDSYGGPLALKRFADACHRRGLAVAVDVVYNHLGPEGNYLGEFGGYFTDRYRTPWGEAVNFDGPFSDEVRRYFIENALYWITEFHIDALRLDAVHAIVDCSAQPFLAQLADCVHQRAEQLGRQVQVIAESDRNDARLVREIQKGGEGLDGLWNDDFHHSVHVLLTGERAGYYADFGEVGKLAKVFTEGFAYSGEYSAYRKRRFGNSARDIPARRFVVFSQNHDQVGNRMLGERLAQLVSFEDLKLAAGITLLSPFLPLLFMGEEYGENAPFLYFVNHSDPDLIEAVRNGRKREFRCFDWRGEPPDPQAESTFLTSQLHWDLRAAGSHTALRAFYKELIGLRSRIPALAELRMQGLQAVAFEAEKALVIRRSSKDAEGIAVFNFGREPARLPAVFPEGVWRKKLDSADERWQGAGGLAPAEVREGGKVMLTLPPRSFVVYTDKSLA
jgi:maltooligosyltrehalose trehalohydrolase